jgi:hypothetical protein
MGQPKKEKATRTSPQTERRGSPGAEFAKPLPGGRLWGWNRDLGRELKVMPWKVSDVEKHKKGLTQKQKKRWVEIANSILSDCRETKPGDKNCEAQAIRIANSRVGKGSDG